MVLILVILAGIMFLLAALSAVLPIPHPIPMIAFGLGLWMTAGQLSSRRDAISS